jgi:hypothetical protein
MGIYPMYTLHLSDTSTTTTTMMMMMSMRQVYSVQTYLVQGHLWSIEHRHAVEQ